MIKTLTGPEFVNLFCLNPKQFAWFFGAGTSASAGIPTGYAMIKDFKKRLFCQLSGTNQHDVDANDPLWIERITLFFSSRDVLPPDNDPAEYAAAFEAVYAEPESRRMYIEEAIRKGTPSFAHRVIASLITMQLVPCVFTTNFDQLVETATTVTDQLMPVEDRVHMSVAAIDNPGRAELCLKESRWPLLAKLHGDFQSVELKNTEKELKEQDATIRTVLTKTCHRFGLVVVGYSGRDDSVMKTLTGALSETHAYPGGIFWVTRSSKKLLPEVRKYLDAAVEAGISTSIIECPTFDELAGDIFNVVEFPTMLREHIVESRPDPILRQTPLPINEQRLFPVLQSSAIPILSIPDVARCIEVETPVSTVRVRELIREAGVKAIGVSVGRNIAAFGSDENLVQSFSSIGGRVAGTIDLNPDKDSWAKGLIYDALIRAVCRKQPLLARFRRKGHFIIVSRGFVKDDKKREAWRKSRLSELQKAYSAALTGKVPEYKHPFSEGVRLRLEMAVDRWWCAFEPFTDVVIPRDESENKAADKKSKDSGRNPLWRANPIIDWQRERWARRYNKVWSRILSAWAGLLAGENNGIVNAIGLQDGKGIDAVFELSPVTAWSRPNHNHDYFLRG